MSVAEIDAFAASAKLAGFHVVDVRADHELVGPLGHLAGLSWIPLPELEARAQELAGRGPLLLVCRSGARSRKACEILEAQGVGPATNLAGGMIAWNRAKLAAEHPAPATLAELVTRIARWLAQVSAKSEAEARASLALWAAPEPFDPPTHQSVTRAIGSISRNFGSSAPPDIDLSTAAFDRWLMAL